VVRPHGAPGGVRGRSDRDGGAAGGGNDVHAVPAVRVAAKQDPLAVGRGLWGGVALVDGPEFIFRVGVDGAPRPAVGVEQVEGAGFVIRRDDTDDEGRVVHPARAGRALGRLDGRGRIPVFRCNREVAGLTARGAEDEL